jgi:hypothetical protein
VNFWFILLVCIVSLPREAQNSSLLWNGVITLIVKKGAWQIKIILISLVSRFAAEEVKYQAVVLIWNALFFFVRKHTYIYIIGEVTRACLRCNIVFSTAPSILSLSICGRSPCQSGNLKLNSFPYLKDLYPSGLLETQWPSHYCAFAPMQFH